MKKVICKYCQGLGAFDLCTKCGGYGYFYTYERKEPKPSYNKPFGTAANDKRFD